MDVWSLGRDSGLRLSKEVESRIRETPTLFSRTWFNLFLCSSLNMDPKTKDLTDGNGETSEIGVRFKLSSWKCREKRSYGPISLSRRVKIRISVLHIEIFMEQILDFYYYRPDNLLTSKFRSKNFFYRNDPDHRV